MGFEMQTWKVATNLDQSLPKEGDRFIHTENGMLQFSRSLKHVLENVKLNDTGVRFCCPAVRSEDTPLAPLKIVHTATGTPST